MTARTATSEVTLLTELPQPSSAYKRRVWLAVLGLLGFMTAYLVLAGWFVYTAWRLKQNDPTLNVAVFEYGDRIGGRLYSYPIRTSRPSWAACAG